MAVDSNILLESGTNELEIVEFIIKVKSNNGSVENHYFGINVAKVREIIRMPGLTQLPNLPKSVIGVFNLRDTIIPALNLADYLYKYNSNHKNQKMIIAEFNKIKSGFIVDDVNRIHRISWSQIESPEALQEFNSDDSTVVGIIKLEDRNILMLDVEKIIADIDPSSAMDRTKINIKMTGKPIAVTAEDSATIRKMISDRLNMAGFEIHSFNDGFEAWQFLQEIANSVKTVEELKTKVNVIITDIEMPQMDGYSLTKQVKSHPLLSKIPVLIFSSIVSQEILHKGKSVGADAQLTKPQIGELLETVRNLLA
jgi:two-component system chemotaxis response regulator CheV